MAKIDRDKIMGNFRNVLKMNSLRYTKEREDFFIYLLDRQGHFDADTLHHEMAKKNISISRATIYRTLDVLTKAKLLRRSHFSDSQATYELNLRNSHHHDHLICIHCNTVVEFFNEDIEVLQETVAKDFGFLLAEHTMNLYGTCPTCQKKFAAQMI